MTDKSAKITKEQNEMIRLAPELRLSSLSVYSVPTLMEKKIYWGVLEPFAYTIKLAVLLELKSEKMLALLLNVWKLNKLHLKIVHFKDQDYAWFLVGIEASWSWLSASLTGKSRFPEVVRTVDRITRTSKRRENARILFLSSFRFHTLL